MTIGQTPCTKEFFALCTVEELPIGLGRAFDVNGRTLAVFRSRKGEIFATDNRCPHKGGPLADGMIARDGDGHPQVVCPLHAFRFDGVTGECDQASTCAVQTHALRVVGNKVFIRIPI